MKKATEESNAKEIFTSGLLLFHLLTAINSLNVISPSFILFHEHLEQYLIYFSYFNEKS